MTNQIYRVLVDLNIEDPCTYHYFRQRIIDFLGKSIFDITYREAARAYFRIIKGTNYEDRGRG